MSESSPFTVRLPKLMTPSRYSWVSSQKWPPRTSLAAKSLLRLMPEGVSVRMAWAMSGRAHRS